MEQVRSILEIFASIVTILGLPVLIWSIFLLVRQLRMQAYQSVYDSVLAIEEILTNNPTLIGYVLNGKELPENDPIERDKVINAIGMMLDFFEHLISHKKLLEKDVWKGWEIYMRDIYMKNPAVQIYVQENQRWYTDRLFKVIGFEPGADKTGN